MVCVSVGITCLCRGDWASRTVLRFDSEAWGMKVILRSRIKVYGDWFTVELREYKDVCGNTYYQMVDVFENCEHDRGIPIDSLKEAVRCFEDAIGKILSDEYKNYLAV